ncbi:L,D-transpeptidase family protein [Paraflavisolibacter sp. H34]|uniref:L,D-transpeptidase family protein n=1 Tax=Huijunlia imazamoxiresistens TaxID=3127457 RepID=UPI0030169E34
MKNISLYILLACSTLWACGQSNSTHSGTNEAAEEKTEKKISSRDFGITKANSYSTLFLDSAAMEKYLADKAIPDSIARRIRSFYNARNYQFAWFSSDGLTEQARGFWNLYDYNITYNRDTLQEDKKLLKRMDNLIAAEKIAVNSTSPNFLNTEFALTHRFIHYALRNYEDGYVKRKEMERFVPRKKEALMAVVDSLLNKKHKDDKYFEDINQPYRLLKEQLGRYYQLAKQGGWQPITAGTKTLKKGDSTSAAIPALKRRLQLTGDLPGQDTSRLFNDSLEIAVKTFQERHGFKPDGKVSPALVKELNVPVQQRLAALLMNMERMRWMPQRPAGNLILVNIPEFVLHVYEGKNRAWDMNVVVGKEGSSTMMFTGDLNQIVFSPYWNVPQSIVQDEIVPAMAKDPGYLDRQNMEITGEEDGLPVVRQRPGPDNSLGSVKFLFPNSFNIYFHDTNAKSLFSRAKRAFSHGCIRLEEPERMAQYLLRHQPEWTPEKIREAMDSGQEKWVKLKDPVPVFITYYTAWVDDSGRLNFREDIYGHDKRLQEKMFQ